MCTVNEGKILIVWLC